MKKTALLLFQSLLLAGSASAVTVFSEDFAYADGALDGRNGGTGFTGAWGAGNFTVSSGAAFSNPNAGTQNSTQDRAFASFLGSQFVFTLDYNVNVNAEGSYDMHVVLLDSNGLEILSVGNRNNQDGAGEFYVARLGTGGGAGNQTFANIGASGTFTDTLTLSATISGTSLTDVDISSTAFPAMNVTGFSRDLGSAIDFSSGGTLRIEKSNLDNMQITVDNVSLEAIPEPGALGLLGVAAICLFVRRRR